MTKFNKSDVRDYLYQKIKDNDYTDEEYGFYLDIRRYGKDAFLMNEQLHKKILRNMNKEYNEEI